MPLSIFDLYKVGVGPSSSHTVGPMVAANRFLDSLEELQLMDQVANVKVALYGSLAMTGVGHATDVATMVGLLGEAPDTVDPDLIPQYIREIEEQGVIRLAGTHTVPLLSLNICRFILASLCPSILTECVSLPMMPPV